MWLVVVWMDSNHDLNRATRERPPLASGETSTQEADLFPSVRGRWSLDGLSPAMTQPRAFSLGRNHAQAWPIAFPVANYFVFPSWEGCISLMLTPAPSATVSGCRLAELGGCVTMGTLGILMATNEEIPPH